MEILHTTNEEPFVSGTGHFAGWENRLMKLEDTAILFCREGHAHIMIDLQEYELAPNTQVVLLPDTIVKFTNISPDFTISYIAFSRILFQEVTARLDLSFFRFLKENPCVTLPEERTRSINGLASGIGLSSWYTSIAPPSVKSLFMPTSCLSLPDTYLL